MTSQKQLQFPEHTNLFTYAARNIAHIPSIIAFLSKLLIQNYSKEKSTIGQRLLLNVLFPKLINHSHWGTKLLCILSTQPLKYVNLQTCNQFFLYHTKLEGILKFLLIGPLCIFHYYQQTEQYRSPTKPTWGYIMELIDP